MKSNFFFMKSNFWDFSLTGRRDLTYMPGIISYGAYVPWYRLDCKTVFKAMGWFNPMVLPGEKAVANYDEDSVTMAVAAGIDCLIDAVKRSKSAGFNQIAARPILFLDFG